MEEEDGGSEEAALARQHKREKKELQAKIQSLKNAVPKNDKKRRKQLMEDVAKLEAELEEKHSKELATLTEEKKAALEKERDERIAEAEVENLSGARHLENQKLTQILSERLLQIKHIPSDGHCMYRAIEHQLKYREASATLSSLRQQTADYMQSHAEDFLPFLTNPTTGDMYTLEEFEKYCSETANTPAWGGQLELRALSHILKTPIEVIQADSSPIVVGEEYSGDPVTVVYMRHAYGLGEHYNSVEPLTATPTD